jgi:hypothetical protein
MSASSMVPQMRQVLPHHHHQKKLVSPDSSDDTDKFVSQLFSQRNSPPGLVTSVATSGNGNSPVTWANPLLQSVAGMGYPLMGMSMIGPNHQAMSDASILYGIMGSNGANGADMNLQNTGVNTIPSSLNIPPSLNPTVSSGVISNNSCGSASSGSLPLPSNDTSQSSKDIIHCKSCTLFPPNPSAPSPTTRDKPPGCRTVFVGGLPENVTDELIREIFDRCGEITTIRMSKKNFCHIRFELEHSIETAIFLSGYRVRIGSNSDPPNIGRLHVDYAQARDDLYEWECRQRQLLREQRHRERIEQERLLPPSPPPTVHFSEHEASLVAEKIKCNMPSLITIILVVEN